jgi:hypothetical protein
MLNQTRPVSPITLPPCLTDRPWNYEMFNRTHPQLESIETIIEIETVFKATQI